MGSASVERFAIASTSVFEALQLREADQPSAQASNRVPDANASGSNALPPLHPRFIGLKVAPTEVPLNEFLAQPLPDNVTKFPPTLLIPQEAFTDIRDVFNTRHKPAENKTVSAALGLKPQPQGPLLSVEMVLHHATGHPIDIAKQTQTEFAQRPDKSIQFAGYLHLHNAHRTSFTPRDIFNVVAGAMPVSLSYDGSIVSALFLPNAPTSRVAAPTVEKIRTQFESLSQQKILQISQAYKTKFGPKSIPRAGTPEGAHFDRLISSAACRAAAAKIAKDLGLVIYETEPKNSALHQVHENSVSMENLLQQLHSIKAI
jgi:hypothetical protein